jgi:hypothetical protein
MSRLLSGVVLNERKKMAESITEINDNNPTGLQALQKGVSGSFHVSKRNVKIAGAAPHESDIPTLSVVDNNLLPPYFSWIDNRSLFNPKYPRFPCSNDYDYNDIMAIPSLPNNIPSFVLPPVNQLTCGNCYAVSSANMTTSRFAIWGLQRPVRLSYYQLTDCSSVANKDLALGCSGGNPVACYDYMNQYGIIHARQYQDLLKDKYPETTVDSNGTKTTYPSGQASYNPNVTGNPNPSPDTCTSLPSDAKVFKCSGVTDSQNAEDNNKPVQFTTIDSIKMEIINNGPVVAMYKVWDDFNYPSMYDMHLWPETNNIYIRGAYQSRKDITIDQYIQTYGNLLNVTFTSRDIDAYKSTFKINTKGNEDKDVDTRWKLYWTDCHKTMTEGDERKQISDSDSNVIGHAVVIVGWGVEYNVKNYGTVEYWIVQNSWGAGWNDNGYFKIAMTKQKNNAMLNQGVGIDLMTNDNYGGVFAWKPNIRGKDGEDVDENGFIRVPRLPLGPDRKPVKLIPNSQTCRGNGNTTNNTSSPPPSTPQPPSIPPPPSTPPPPPPPSTPPPPPPSTPNMFPMLPFFTPDDVQPAQPGPASPQDDMGPTQRPTKPIVSPTPIKKPETKPTIQAPAPAPAPALAPSPSPAQTKPNNTTTPTNKSFSPLEIAGISLGLFIFVGLLIYSGYRLYHRSQATSTTTLPSTTIPLPSTTIPLPSTTIPIPPTNTLI